MMPTFASASAAYQKNNPTLHDALKTKMPQWVAAPPCDTNTLCESLGIDYKRLWQWAQIELGAVPSDLIDVIYALAALQKLAQEPAVKVIVLMHHLGFRSESAFCKFCRRVFSMLPSRIKEKPKAAFAALKRNYPTLDSLIVEADIFPKRKSSIFKPLKKTLTKQSRTTPPSKTEEKKRSKKQQKKTEEKNSRRKA